jgi:hypothetical protein
MSATVRNRAWKLVLGGFALAGAVMGGCESAGTKPEADSPTPVVASKPVPSYAEVAAEYNRRVLPLDRLIARATIRLTYTGQDGERHTEQPDGTLQIVRPNKLAIDLGKGGKKLFWFGSDDERYWWLDLTDPDDRYAAVGRHSAFEDNQGAAGRRLGIALHPRDLIVAVGVTPLDPKARGVTQWSRDGSRLGIVVPLTDGRAGRNGSGLQRIWVDPKTMVPRSIELFDAQRRLVIRAEHSGEERVTITRTGVPGGVGARPLIPGQITCRHIESDTEIRLSLSDAKDGPISDKAFQLDELIRRLSVARVIDLDEPVAAKVAE